MIVSSLGYRFYCISENLPEPNVHKFAFKKERPDQKRTRRHQMVPVLWVVAPARTHLIQLRATHFHNSVIGSGVQVWSGWGTPWFPRHTESDAVIRVRFTLWVGLSGLEDILSSSLSNHPLHFFVFISRHSSSSSSFFSVGFFSLEWFVYPQFPWVISAVIITGVGNKHTHSVSSAHKQTHTYIYIYIHNGMKNNFHKLSHVK